MAGDLDELLDAVHAQIAAAREGEVDREAAARERERPCPECRTLASGRTRSHLDGPRAAALDDRLLRRATASTPPASTPRCCSPTRSTWSGCVSTSITRSRCCPSERDRFRALVQRRATIRVPVSQLLGERGVLVAARSRSPRTCSRRVPRRRRWSRRPWPSCPIATRGLASWISGPDRVQSPSRSRSERPEPRSRRPIFPKAALQIAAENADESAGEREDPLPGRRPLRAGRVRAVRPDRLESALCCARTTEGTLPPELAHEPEMALFGGADGFEVIRRLIDRGGRSSLSGGLAPDRAGPDAGRDGRADSCRGWLRGRRATFRPGEATASRWGASAGVESEALRESLRDRTRFRQRGREVARWLPRRARS